ncbi:hypothetical protein SDC9_161202 [bioreactor metagenome]|uniref:Uncharacterized protein n=1 Tax=bioreactor metagenome TaxID=1076179 RepID=A0A645FJP3_9ZZZZ
MQRHPVSGGGHQVKHRLHQRKRYTYAQYARAYTQWYADSRKAQRLKAYAAPELALCRTYGR